MKKILFFALVLMMLFSFVACSGTLVGENKRPLTSELPMETRPVKNESVYDDTARKPFNSNDPRKKYLEEKYGVTAYLVAEKSSASLCSYFALDGYEGVFQLYTKEDLISSGVSEEVIQGDFVDNAYFTVAYPDIYEYFKQAITESGVKVERMIIQSRARYTSTNIYDLDKTFAECLASTENSANKRFEIKLYGDFDNGDNAAGKLLTAFDKLDFSGTLQFLQVKEDISGLTNEDLTNYQIYSNYVELYYLQQIK